MTSSSCFAVRAIRAASAIVLINLTPACAAETDPLKNANANAVGMCEPEPAPPCCSDPSDPCRWNGNGACDEGCAWGADIDCGPPPPYCCGDHTDPCGWWGNGSCQQGCAWGEDPDCAPPPVCNPETQPWPAWGEKNGRCLPVCPTTGRHWCQNSGPCSPGTLPVGDTYNCEVCCVYNCCGDPTDSCRWRGDGTCNRGCAWGNDPDCPPEPPPPDCCGDPADPCGWEGDGTCNRGCAWGPDPDCNTPPPPVCDPSTQPPPHWGQRNGRCLPSCGSLGGTHCGGGAQCPSGMSSVGDSYDCNACCKADPEPPPPDCCGNPSDPCGWMNDGVCHRGCAWGDDPDCDRPPVP